MGWPDLAARCFAAVETHFGEEAVLTPAAGRPRAGEAVAIKAVFDEAHEIVGDDQGVGVSTTGPVAALSIASLQTAGLDPARGDALTIRGRAFTIVERPQTDGHASLVCILGDD